MPFMPRQDGGYSSKVESESPANLLAYWQLNEGAGPTAGDSSGNSRTGTEVGSPTWGQTGIGDGKTSVLFDGANDAIDIFSAGLQAAFDGEEGTMAWWAKVSAVGDWSDGTLRWFFYLFADGDNFVRIIKLNTNNNVQFAYRSGGTAQLSRTVAIGPTVGWFHVAITWSRAVNEVRSYLDGVEAAAVLTITDDFVGSLATNNTTLAATSNVPASVWNGYLAHAAVWDTPLTASQILNLATL
jgi:hypothetical protein